MPKPLSEYPELMTVNEVAEYFRCCTKSVYEMVRSGKLQTYRIGNSIRIVKSCLFDLAA